jgi:hypothetical protein
MCPGSSHSTTRAALMTRLVVVTYRRRVSPGSNEVRTGGLEMSALRLLSTFYVLSDQRKESDVFNNLYRGAHVPLARI